MNRPVPAISLRDQAIITANALVDLAVEMKQYHTWARVLRGHASDLRAAAEAVTPGDVSTLPDTRDTLVSGPDGCLEYVPTKGNE